MVVLHNFSAQSSEDGLQSRVQGIPLLALKWRIHWEHGWTTGTCLRASCLHLHVLICSFLSTPYGWAKISRGRQTDTRTSPWEGPARGACFSTHSSLICCRMLIPIF
ncbi:hypothetical protein BRADI_2g46617v3 [Brachypodium distachyon]|uniref:Uncharacterized protein n=1 Tax=Brachypodium distachyon TaxID=15368 RepID=A0A2K2DE91_BRADI|nr:hypothetical protein BRADI_2g46617v3 [Brachypodium distachyon]